jgi:hypothetical protein
MNPRASSGLKKRCKHRGIKPRLRVRRSFTRRRIKYQILTKYKFNIGFYLKYLFDLSVYQFVTSNFHMIEFQQYKII